MNSPLFDPDSEACHAALEDLRDALIGLGFAVRKKATNEATLRVYPRGFGRYPLLNPRFQQHAMYKGNHQDSGFVVFTVLSKGDDVLDHALRSIPSMDDCDFVPGSTAVGIYHHHGDFVVPLTL